MPCDYLEDYGNLDHLIVDGLWEFPKIILAFLPDDQINLTNIESRPHPPELYLPLSFPDTFFSKSSSIHNSIGGWSSIWPQANPMLRMQTAFGVYIP